MPVSWRVHFNVSNDEEVHQIIALVLKNFPGIRLHGVTPQAEQVEIPKLHEQQQEQQKPVIASVPDQPAKKKKSRTTTSKIVAPNGGKSWKEGDIAFLLAHPEMSDEQAAKSLGRTAAAIMCKKWEMEQHESQAN